MKVWSIYPLDSCDWIKPEQKWSIDYKQTFDGRSKRTDWTPIKMKLASKGSRSKKADFFIPSGLSGYVIDQKACTALMPYINASVEFLPLEYGGEQVYFMNVIDVRDCLDRSRSDISYFEDTDEIIYIRKIAFDKKSLMDAVIFRVKEVPTYGPYVTDEFIEAYRSADLQGLDFELVWDSDSSDKEIGCVTAEVLPPTDTCFDYCRQIDSEIEEKIIEFSRTEQSCLGVNLEKDTIGAVQALNDEVQRLLDEKDSLNEENIPPLSIQFGSLFGEALCKGYGWEWVEVGSGPDDSLYAVVSPMHLYCVFPLQFIKRVLDRENTGPDGMNDNTVMLLYNMLDGIERNIPDKRLTPLS